MLLSRLSRVLLLRLPKRICNLRIPRRYEGHFDAKAYQLGVIGNREQVGFGTNGQPAYQDRADFPFPSIRYMEPSPKIEALRGKERGDWRLLTLEEKKRLYRASFCQTFTEFQAPTGEWRHTVGWALFYVCLGIWMYIIQLIYAYEDYPESFSEENRKAQMRRQIDLHMNPITGIGSEWDYQKKDWKRKTWTTPENPFIDPCTGDYGVFTSYK